MVLRSQYFFVQTCSNIVFFLPWECACEIRQFLKTLIFRSQRPKVELTWSSREGISKTMKKSISDEIMDFWPKLKSCSSCKRWSITVRRDSKDRGWIHFLTNSFFRAASGKNFNTKNCAFLSLNSKIFWQYIYFFFKRSGLQKEVLQYCITFLYFRNLHPPTALLASRRPVLHSSFIRTESIFINH